MSLAYRTIGIKGNRIGCGKDTVTQLIISEMRKRGIILQHKKFATPIRDVLKVLTNFDQSFTETTEGKSVQIAKAGKTIGKLLQDIGSAMKHVIHDEVWIDAVYTGINDDDLVIFSDVRFPKELESVINRDGIIIEVRRSNQPELDNLAGRSSLHESETALKGCDVDIIINNDASIEELQASVSRIIDMFLLNKP